MKQLMTEVDQELWERVQQMPYGVRSAVIRTLLEKVLDAADRRGQMIYGAVIGGDFKIVYREDREDRRKPE